MALPPVSREALETYYDRSMVPRYDPDKLRNKSLRPAVRSVRAG